jgi:NADH-quinone oxidoreductase subunit N
VVAFLGSVPKLAAFALAIRVLVEGLGGLHHDWQGMLVILAVLSMGVGNLVAIAQTNLKRMLAYSTISHVGFIFLGLLAGTDQGYASAMFYAMVYAPMAAGSFGILALISRKGFDAENLDDLKGLNERDSWYAAMMALLMFSMAGVPPTVGFMAKLLVLEAVVRIDLVWLAVVAVFFSIIGAFYYLRVVKVMYFDKPLTDAPLVTSGGVRVAMSVNGLAMLVLGLFPASLLALCQAAFL